MRKTGKWLMSICASMILIISVIAILSGCSNVFDKDYTVVTEHKGDYFESDDDSSQIAVKNYAGMKSAILSLVNTAGDGLVMTTENYFGDAREDISRVCLEVTRELPIGVYAVDYMTHVCTQILSYYKIEVFVTYKRTPEEIASIRRLNSGPAFLQAAVAAAAEMEDVFTCNLVASNVTKDELIDALTETYRERPLFLSEIPEIEFEAYPNLEAVQKIIEVKYKYSDDPSWVKAKKAIMLNDAATIGSGIDRNTTKIVQAMELCNALSAHSVYNPDGANTAYDTLHLRSADSEGFAMAYELLCGLSNIYCRVVVGRLDGVEHFWNIIEYKDEYYHVDVSVCENKGIESSFLRKDSDMWGSYWWDTEQYEKCEGSLELSGIYENNGSQPELPAVSESTESSP